MADSTDPKEQAKKLAEAFTKWVATESNIDFWSENNAEEQLAEMAVSFITAAVSLVQADCDALQRTFNLQWDADQRAIKRWQEAHPGNDLVWPDRANMVVWLMEQYDAQGKK
jgi:peptide subunit release factor 1 (eRF1)